MTNNDYLLGQIDSKLASILTSQEAAVERIVKIEDQISDLKVSRGRFLGAAAIVSILISGFGSWLGLKHGP